jgi:hypothetical protein
MERISMINTHKTSLIENILVVDNVKTKHFFIDENTKFHLRDKKIVELVMSQQDLLYPYGMKEIAYQAVTEDFILNDSRYVLYVGTFLRQSGEVFSKIYMFKIEQ